MAEDDLDDLDDILDSALDDFIAEEPPRPAAPGGPGTPPGAKSASDLPPAEAVDQRVPDAGRVDAKAAEEDAGRGSQPEPTGADVKSVLDELNSFMSGMADGDGDGEGLDLNELGQMDDASLDEFVNKLAEQFQGMQTGEGLRGTESVGSGGAAAPREAASSSAGGPTPTLEGMVESIVSQLLSKDVLKGPMLEMRGSYETFLGAKGESLPAEELQRFRTQQECVIAICDMYERDAPMTEIMDKLHQMQDCGAPPQEVIDKLSSGDGDEGDDSGPLDPAELAKLERLQQQCPVQ